MAVSVRGAELFYSMRGEEPPCLVLCSMGTTSHEAQMPARLEYFEKSEHPPFFEEPDRFVATVTEWLDRQGASLSGSAIAGGDR